MKFSKLKFSRKYKLKKIFYLNTQGIKFKNNSILKIANMYTITDTAPLKYDKKLFIFNFKKFYNDAPRIL